MKLKSCLTKIKCYSLPVLAAMGFLASYGVASASISTKPTVIPIQIDSQDLKKGNKLAACLLKIESVILNNKDNEDQSKYLLTTIVAVSSREALISGSLNQITSDNKKIDSIRLSSIYLSDDAGYNNLSELSGSEEMQDSVELANVFKLGPKTLKLLTQSFQAKKLLLTMKLKGEEHAVVIKPDLVLRLNTETSHTEATQDSIKFLDCISTLAG